MEFTKHGDEIMCASCDELDKCALEEDSIFLALSYPTMTRARGSTGQIPGTDWEAEWTGTRGVGNRGLLRIFPTSPRSEAVWAEGKIRTWERAGLSRSQAEAVFSAYKGAGDHNSRAYAAELIKLIDKYEEYKDIFLAYEQPSRSYCDCEEDGCPSCEYDRRNRLWHEAWAETLPDLRDSWSSWDFSDPIERAEQVREAYWIAHLYSRAIG